MTESRNEKRMTFYFNNETEVPMIVDQHNNPWFQANRVGDVLGLGNIHSSLASLEDYEKVLRFMDTLGGKQQTTFISESALYKLIFKSRKPEAKAFQKWVVEDILPTIRRTGAYSTHSILESKQERIQLLKDASELLVSIQMLDERSRTMIHSEVLNLMTPTIEGSSSQTSECSVSKRVLDRHGVQLSSERHRALLISIGRACAREYKRRHDGQTPSKRSQYVDGTLRDVSQYTLSDWTEYLDDILDQFFVSPQEPHA